jgi:uncharacterized membrane protein
VGFAFAMFNRCRWSLVPFALVALACAVPWLFAHSPELAFALRRAFALVCHQRPDRSFVLFGGTVAVCARCLGAYVGAAAGLLLWVPRQLAWRCFVPVAALNALDWLAEIIGLHGNLTSLRFALGIALGLTAAMLINSARTMQKTSTYRENVQA